MSTILVVDDNPSLVDVLLEMLHQGKYRAFGVYSGEECLKILKDVKPDLILLDIMMEPMDGWETLVKIKGEITTAQIPVLMLTAKEVTQAKWRSMVNSSKIMSSNPSRALSFIM
jgi:CheY-like chemotaxis protein